MNKVFDIQHSDDPRDVLHHVVEQLAHGEIIVLPSETTYCACASLLNPTAISRLIALNSQHGSQRLTLLIKNKEEAQDYVPSLHATANRLLKRCWPGPITFAFPFEDNNQNRGSSLVHAFEPTVKSQLLLDRELWLCAPHSELLQYVLHLSNGPIVALELETNNQTEPPALIMQAEQVNKHYPAGITAIIDQGPTRYQQPQTVIYIENGHWNIKSAGIVSEHIIKQMACEMYLFVCTGNTCRSPMAEGMFRKIMSDRLQCNPDALVDRGVIAVSAGLSAAIGAAASPETVRIMAERGINLTDHVSQPLTNQLLDQADHIYTMTHQHRDSILAERPELKQRVEVLSRNGSDISDPIGGGMEEYLKCEREIEKHLQSILNAQHPGQPPESQC